MGNGIRDQDLGARYLHFSTQSADKLGHLGVNVYNMDINMYANIPVYVLCMHVDRHMYCRNCEFSFFLFFKFYFLFI